MVDGALSNAEFPPLPLPPPLPPNCIVGDGEAEEEDEDEEDDDEDEEDDDDVDKKGDEDSDEEEVEFVKVEVAARKIPVALLVAGVVVVLVVEELAARADIVVVAVAGADVGGSSAGAEDDGDDELTGDCLAASELIGDAMSRLPATDIGDMDVVEEAMAFDELQVALEVVVIGAAPSLTCWQLWLAGGCVSWFIIRHDESELNFCRLLADRFAPNDWRALFVDELMIGWFSSFLFRLLAVVLLARLRFGTDGDMLVCEANRSLSPVAATAVCWLQPIACGWLQPIACGWLLSSNCNWC